MKRAIKIIAIILIIIIIIPIAFIGVSFVPINRQMNDIFEKTDGFIAGVCHPNEDYSQIKEANLNWVRFDIPYPYDEQGELSSSYLSFRQRAQGYNDNNIKVMAITPYPRDYVNDGADPRTEHGAKKVVEVTRFIINDIKDFVHGIQITNEMGMAHFTMPLTTQEGAKFIAMQLKGIDDIKGDLIVGFNAAGVNLNIYLPLIPYRKYIDYVGIDLYEGSFGPGSFEMFYTILHLVHSMFKKPVIIQEFGYMSKGRIITHEVKQEVLEGYGYLSEQEARDDIVTLVQEKLSDGFRNSIVAGYPDFADWEYALFETANYLHFYEGLPENYLIKGYPHTPQGQADFYTKIIPDLQNISYIAGLFIYSYYDAPICYHCGSSTCPIETGWGLVDSNGEANPSYYAVKEALE